MGRTRISAAGGAALALACSIAGLLTTLTACSETTRYRVLSFFLDGVPDPSAWKAAAEPAAGASPVEPSAPRSEKLTRQYYAHTPYRDDRCGGCHNIETGQLLRSLEEGLCLSCHAGLVVGDRFVHGPVAVHDCTVCHHHHAAPFPNLLLTPETAMCLGCHDAEAVAEGEHHAGTEGAVCTHCHDPHGGGERFFLRVLRASP